MKLANALCRYGELAKQLSILQPSDINRRRETDPTMRA